MVWLLQKSVRVSLSSPCPRTAADPAAQSFRDPTSKLLPQGPISSPAPGLLYRRSSALAHAVNSKTSPPDKQSPLKPLRTEE